MKALTKITVLIVSFFLLVVLVFEFSTSKGVNADTFVVRRGDNILQVVSNLKRAGYINNKLPFLIKSLKDKNYTKIKAGTYKLDKQMSYDQVMDILVKGSIVSKSLTILPGWSIKEVAANFSSKGIYKKQAFYDDYLNLDEEKDKNLKIEFSFLEDKPVIAGLEGYLYPDTYSFNPGETLGSAIKQILSNFDKKLTENLRQEIKKQNKTVFEIVTMASILEKEVKTDEDKRMVSGVLWKRLNAGMLLEVDSTLLYFLVSDFPSVDDKNVSSLYNTYKYSGLPVGPICNPSIESIEAAIHPIDTDYWFYLSAANGQTIFSKNFNEHIINKAKYLNNNN